VRWLRVLLGCAFPLGCGPIDAPRGAVDLRTSPEALRSAFDGSLGVRRLVLLLSPA
jgi:hypothetical protein